LINPPVALLITNIKQPSFFPAAYRLGAGASPAATLRFGGLLLHRSAVTALSRRRRDQRAVVERLLRCFPVLRLAGPSLLRRSLQAAAIRVGQLPRHAHLGRVTVDCVKVDGGFLVGLAAGQEGDAG